MEVLRLLARGKSNKEIGVGLHISETTVKSHVKEHLRQDERPESHGGSYCRRPERVDRNFDLGSDLLGLSLQESGAKVEDLP
jgi:hypothetical protein